MGCVGAQGWADNAPRPAGHQSPARAAAGARPEGGGAGLLPAPVPGPAVPHLLPPAGGGCPAPCEPGDGPRQVPPLRCRSGTLSAVFHLRQARECSPRTLQQLLPRLFIDDFFLSYFWPCHAVRGILVPQPGMEPGPPAPGARSLNHWTTREAPCRAS